MVMYILQVVLVGCGMSGMHTRNIFLLPRIDALFYGAYSSNLDNVLLYEKR